MRILFIGPQGSGKSTQAKLLAEYLKIPYISTGDIFREIASTNETIRKILDEGKLVENKTTSELVRDRLKQEDCQNGFILDGYPRNLDQIKLYDPKFNLVFSLDIKEEEIISRLTKRGREDDTSESIKQRLDIYFQQTKPLLNFFREKGILKEINGEGSVLEISQNIKKILSNEQN